MVNSLVKSFPLRIKETFLIDFIEDIIDVFRMVF